MQVELTGIQYNYSFYLHQFNDIFYNNPAIYIFIHLDTNHIGEISIKPVNSYNILYIGESLILKNRIQQHLNQQTDQGICALKKGANALFISYMNIPASIKTDQAREMYLKIFEQDLIIAYRPPCNHQYL